MTDMQKQECGGLDSLAGKAANARESQRVYHVELGRKAGSWHTAEQGGGLIVCR